MERNANNEWRVDTSELLRAYGQFVETQQDHDTKHDPSRRETGFLREVEAHNEKLERIITTLEMALETHRETINDIRARLDASEQERRDAQKTIQLLTHDKTTAPHKKKLNIWLVVAITTTVTALVIAVIYAIKTNVISL